MVSMAQAYTREAGKRKGKAREQIRFQTTRNKTVAVYCAYRIRM